MNQHIPSRAFEALAPPRKRSRAPLSKFTVPYVCAPMMRASTEAAPRRGETIRRFVDRLGWEGRGLPIVCGEMVGGELQPILRKDWPKRRIRKRDSIVFVAMPLGGGAGGAGGGTSAQVGAIAAVLGVIALAAFAGPFAAGLLFQTGTYGFSVISALVSGIVVAGGSYLISHFLNSVPKGATSSAGSVSSVQINANQARSQEPIPAPYGRLKFFPDLAAPIYNTYSGPNQLFYGLYSLGVGLFDVEEIGVGLTPVWTAAHGLSAAFPNFKFQIVPPDTDCTLFPTNVTSSSNVSGQQLPNSGGTGFTYLGPFIANPSGTLANSIAVDLIWPAGCFANLQAGGTQATSVHVSCLYQYVDGSGTPTTGTWLTGFDQVFSLNSAVPVRITKSFDLPAPGRVQVEVARAGNANAGANVDTVVWGALKAYLQGPNAVPHATRLAVQILADKQLSSYAAQQIYVVATRKLPVWNGTAFVTQATQSPVWAALDIWTNTDYGAGLSVNDVDLVVLKTYADAAAVRGDTFNFRFTTQIPVVEALSTALQGMLANPVFVWDKLSMVRDEPRGIPTIMLTDFEIVRGSLSVAYTLQDQQTSDGTIVEYFEETTWAAAEVRSVADNVDLLRPARVKADGVTNRRQAVVFARYLAASNAYRRKIATMTIEAEGKLLRRGDLVSVQSETPNTWGAAFRIDAADAPGRSLTLHAPADWSSGAQHYIRIKTPIGGGFGPVKCGRGGSDSIVIIDAVDQALVEMQQGTTLAAVVARTPVEESPSASLSVAAPQEFMGLVTSLGNAGESQFVLALVVDAPQVYTIDTTSVPALPTPSLLALPSVPGVIDPLNAYLKQVGITVTLYASWTPDSASQFYTAQISYDAGATWTTVYPDGEVSSFFVAGLAPTDLLLRVRGKSALDVTGPWSQVAVASPTVNYQPSNLGYQIQYYDIQPAASDASINDDQAELQTFVSQVGLSSRIQQAQNTANAAGAAVIQAVTGTFPGLVLDFASATTGLSIQVGAIQASLNTLTLTEITDVGALSGQIDTLNASFTSLSDAFSTSIGAAQATINAATAATQTQLGAAFGVEDDQHELQLFANQVASAGATASSLGLVRGAQAVVAQQAIANATAAQALTQVTDTQASQIAANASLIQSVSTTLTSTTDSLASRTTTLESTVNSGTSGLAVTRAALSTEATTRATADTAITASISTLSSTVSSNTASITTETLTRASADSALSSSISSVSAMSLAGTANGSVNWQVQSSLAAGVSAGYDVTLTASGFTSAIAGLHLELLAGGTGRCVITASQFQIQDPTTRAVPFGISGGAVYLQGVTYVSSTLLSQAVTTAGTTIGQNVMQIDFVNGAITIYDNS